MRTKICFWHRDLLLLGQGLRLLATGRLAGSSFTARFCLMRELARAAIFPPSHLREGGVVLATAPLLVGPPTFPGTRERSGGCGGGGVGEPPWGVERGG